MFTRCPHCESTHPLNAQLLAQAGGRVLCGHCLQEFNALAWLFDDLPGGGSRPAANWSGGSPPLLSAPAPVSFAADPGQLAGVRRRGPAWPWLVLLLLLTLATLFNLGWALREHLPRDGELAKFLQQHGIKGFEEPPPFRDPASVRLLSRDVHPHPTRSGVLVLSASFASHAAASQDFPVLVLTLLDADGKALAGRSFQPAEYLPAGLDPQGQLDPGVTIPLLLEFADPGERAVGFELEFH